MQTPPPSPSVLPRAADGSLDLDALDALLGALGTPRGPRSPRNGHRSPVAQLLAELDALSGPPPPRVGPVEGRVREVWAPPAAPSVAPRGRPSAPPPEMVMQESEVLLDEIPEEERVVHDTPVSAAPPAYEPEPLAPQPEPEPEPVVVQPEPEPEPEPEPLPVFSMEPEPESVVAEAAPLDALLELDLPPLDSTPPPPAPPPTVVPSAPTSIPPRLPTRYPSGILPAATAFDLNLDDLPAPPPVPRGVADLPSLQSSLPPMDEDEVTELETLELLEEETRRLPTGKFVRPSPRPVMPVGGTHPGFAARPMMSRPPPAPTGAGATRPPPPLPPRKPDPQK